MYSNDDLENEEMQEESNGSFLSNFYNNNKKLIWIAGGIIIAIILLSLLSNGKNSNKATPKDNKDLKVVLIDSSEKEIDKAELSIGYSIKLKAKIDGVKNPIFIWSSSDTNVATVDNGLIRGKNLGETTITATYEKENGEDISSSCVVTISEGDKNTPVREVSFPDGDLIMGVNSQADLDLTIYPSTGYVNSKKYSSSDENIVTVDANGRVRAVSLGSATITVDINNGDFKDNIDVYVLENVYSARIMINAEKITFAGTVEKIKVGDRSRLTYDVNPTNADLTRLTWKSSNEECVTVDNNGNITGIKEGTAIISVYNVGEKEIGTVTIEVEQNIIEVSTVSLPTNAITMEMFKEQQIIPIVKPDDASNKSLTYTSSDQSVVNVVSQDNGITATLFSMKEGTATITITSDNGKMAYLIVNVVKPGSSSSSGGYSGGGYSGGSSSSSKGYSITSRDSEHPGVGWMNSGISGAEKEGATAPLTITLSITNSATTKLKVCSYIYGTSECDVNSGTTITGTGSFTLTQKGYWVVKITEFKGDTVRRGPDYWYAQIAKGSSSGSTSATGKCYCNNTSGDTCEWSSTGAPTVAGYYNVIVNYSVEECRARTKRTCCTQESNGKYSVQYVQSRYCEKDSNGNYITNKTTCESKNGGTGTISPTTAVYTSRGNCTNGMVLSGGQKCNVPSGMRCKSGSTSSIIKYSNTNAKTIGNGNTNAIF